MNESRYINDIITTCRNKGIIRLPTLKQLAADSGISRYRLAAAVAAARRSGKLTVTRKGGIRLPCPQKLGNSPANPTRRSRSADLVELLCSRIREGIFAQGSSLPPVKQLCAQYGVHYFTLRKTLDTLSREGWIRRDGSRFLICERIKPQRRNQILFIGHYLDMGAIQNIPERSRDLIRILEMECDNRNLCLQLMTPEMLADSPESARTCMDDVLGIIIWTFFKRRKFIENIVQQLKALNRPMVVFDEFGILPPPGTPLDSTYPCPVVSLAHSADDGYSLGMYLLRNGHSRVAFFSPFSSKRWSALRLKGLRAAFRDGGKNTSIHSYLAHRDDFSKLLPRLETSARALFQPPFVPGGVDVSTTILHQNNTLVELGRYLSHIRIQFTIEPLLSKAAADRKPTAWVCVNDDTAVEALRYCARHGIAVPHDISVIAFDDSPTALYYQLTSYNLNVRGTVSIMLDKLLFPDRKSRCHVVDSVRGYINERSTFSPIIPACTCPAVTSAAPANP